MRDRDPGFEREMVAIATRAAGRPGDGGLCDYADQRAHPGGVRLGVNWDQEAREELADGCSYLVWGIEDVYARFLAGDPDAAAAYSRRMRALVAVVEAWHELHAA